MPRIIHFEIHADSVTRAVLFYRAVFDWKIKRRDDSENTTEYYTIATGKGKKDIDGWLMPRESPSPHENEAVRSFVSIIGVDSIDDSRGKIEANGGRLITPKMAARGLGWICYAEDTEKNVFGIMQHDKDAK